MSRWADVASRYRDSRELRTKGLKSRFIAGFDGGDLTIQLPSGVVRRVDIAEFESAWTIMESGGTGDTLRYVTPSGRYLEAIREDLLAAGLGLGEAGSEADVDIGTVTAVLVQEATTRAARVVSATPDAPSGTRSAAKARLDALELERDELFRELARSKAGIIVLEERLAVESERATKLEAALALKSSAQGGSVGAGSKADPAAQFAAYLRSELEGATQLDPQWRAGIQKAMQVALQHSDLALVQCRKVAEAMAESEYRRVTGADGIPAYKKAVDLMEEIRDRSGVDMTVWNLHRNVFRVSNPAAHVLQEVGSRQFALTVVAMVLTVASHVPSGR